MDKAERIKRYAVIYKELVEYKPVVVPDSDKLTQYQTFVKNESRKTEYRSMQPSEMMSAIALAWEKEKKRLRRQKKTNSLCK